MTWRRILKGAFGLVAAVVAAIYFLIDALVLSMLRPLFRRLANLRLFRAIAPWFESLGPYQTLAAFLIPVVLLEPLKPAGAYFIASGHATSGLVILAFGEVLKITIVERIFHLGRPKLMTIPAFAWGYNTVTGWLAWLQALPPWRAVKRSFAAIVHRVQALRRAGWTRR